jgi:DNA-binding HxlR family transcriptional regulator
MATARNVRTYDHFCLVARSLETLGDRWSLLVVRDLLSGRKRFTDLMDRLGGITPKTLSQRLRELEAAGIVVANRESGRREVWYSVTPAGLELAPVIDSLGDWGLRHAWRGPLAGEPLHPEHLLRAAVRAIDTESDDRLPVSWLFALDRDRYLVECDGWRWSYSTDLAQDPPAVTVTGTGAAFARFVLDGRDDGLVVDGSPDAVDRFRRLIGTVRTVVARTATAD